ncbi:hypothetical protein ACQPX6_28635 [Actinomycetospora sp. CA-101289]|uniref:hypothetical protein n=1 Tax=Actinomycetospora sp. CA-101289 TaxID=3239893 RepID=UPI003D987BC8
MSMAVVMSEMPDVWRRVLAEHVPDGYQNCRACFHAGGRASWPCQTYRIAQEAKWVAEGGLPGTGPHGPGPSRTRLSPPEPLPVSGHAAPDGFARRHSDPLGDPDPLGGPLPPSHPSTGGWASSSVPAGFDLDERPLAGDPRADHVGHAPTSTGERPYGSTFDAPYGASFGVDDRPYARR